MSDKTVGAATGSAGLSAIAQPAAGLPLEAPRATAPGVAASVPGSGRGTSPTAQIGQAAIHLNVAPGQRGDLTIRLHPADLGAVQIHVARAHDGAATITITVERAETLRALQGDLAHLHAALDRAGLPTEARQVNLAQAPAEPGRAPAPEPGAASGSAGWGNPESQARQGQTPPGRGTNFSGETAAAGGFAGETDLPAAWRRVGVNITA